MSVDMVACEACGKPISAQATECPSCGHPRAFPRKPRRWPYVLAGVVMVGLTGCICTSMILFRLERTQYTEQGFPKCDSDIARQQVFETFENSPAGRVHGLQIISFTEARTGDWSGANGIDCRAYVTLNDGRSGQMSFQFIPNETGGIMVRTSFGSFY